jgi:hypothetical protein
MIADEVDRWRCFVHRIHNQDPDGGGPEIRIKLAAARILLDQFYLDKSDLSVTPEDFSIMLSAATAAALT